MKHWAALLAACIVLAFQLHQAQAQGFSFSLPGKWGGAGKRSQIPWLKDGLGECGQYDPSFLLDLYRIIQGEAMRLNDCMMKASRGGNK